MSNLSQVNPWNNKPFSAEHAKLMRERPKLPIDDIKQEIRLLLATNQVSIIMGETGSGKSTGVPKLALEMFSYSGLIVCTQPRQVACKACATRIAAELDVKVGEDVGYRFYEEDMTNKTTKLVFQTDDRLVLDLKNDPTLEKVSCVIVDEAHTCTAAVDIVIADLKLLAKQRPHLKIIIMSATLNGELLKDYFENAALFSIHGRQFPLETRYLHVPTGDWLVSAVEAVKLILTDTTSGSYMGDILVFLPREEDISSAESQISQFVSNNKVLKQTVQVFKLSASMSAVKQNAAISRERTDVGIRKVILSTNVAETTLTIESVDVVIDTGVALQVVFDGETRTMHYTVSPISRPNAIQRAGRAGRCRPGLVFRLYTLNTFQNEMSDQLCPELLTSRMEKRILSMLCRGISDVIGYDFMSCPDETNMERGVELLQILGAIDDDGQVTELGFDMNTMSLDLIDSRMLLAGIEQGCSDEMLTLVAMMSHFRDIFHLPDRVKDVEKFYRVRNYQNSYKHDQNAGDHFKFLRLGEEILRVCNHPEKEFSRWCVEHYISIVHAGKFLKTREKLDQNIRKLSRYKHMRPHQNLSSLEQLERVRMCLATGLCSQVIYRNSEQTTGKYITIHDENEIAIHPNSYKNNDEAKSAWLLCQSWVFTTKRYAECVTPVSLDLLIQCAPKYYSSWADSEVGDHIKESLSRTQNHKLK